VKLKALKGLLLGLEVGQLFHNGGRHIACKGLPGELTLRVVSRGRGRKPRIENTFSNALGVGVAGDDWIGGKGAMDQGLNLRVHSWLLQGHALRHDGAGIARKRPRALRSRLLSKGSLEQLIEHLKLLRSRLPLGVPILKGLHCHSHCKVPKDSSDARKASIELKMGPGVSAVIHLQMRRHFTGRPKTCSRIGL